MLSLRLAAHANAALRNIFARRRWFSCQISQNPLARLRMQCWCHGLTVTNSFLQAFCPSLVHLALCESCRVQRRGCRSWPASALVAVQPTPCRFRHAEVLGCPYAASRLEGAFALFGSIMLKLHGALFLLTPFQSAEEHGWLGVPLVRERAGGSKDG
jgi:hypothetical protein